MTPNADYGGRYRPTAGGLFSGIGGLELGLERAGFDIVWHAETDPYASKVLAKHWPHVPNLGDITQIDWSSVERPDLVCGGYPCQPFSLASAGRRQGADDPRHLWPHMARCLRLLRPRWALLENVPGHLSLGFDTVIADLAALGYDTEWECLPAAAVGAPHLRWRVFVVAHADGNGEPDVTVDGEMAGQLVAYTRGAGGRENTGGAPGDESPDERRLPAHDHVRAGHGQSRRPGTVGGADDMAGTATCTRPRRPGALVQPGPFERAVRPNSGDWDAWEFEPDVGRVADGVPARVDRLRCLGNAVVPQVAEYVGRCILDTLPPIGRSATDE
jgi:DNA (cytosine-5)-methyltransferase 1